MREYRFFLHYNKPLSKQKGKHMWSVHFKGSCFFTENIQCNVKTESKTNKRQPYVVMRGMAKSIVQMGNTIVIE